MSLSKIAGKSPCSPGSNSIVPQRGRTPHIEDMHKPDSRRVHDHRYLFGEVMHVPVAFGAERDLLLIGHERLPRMDNEWLIWSEKSKRRSHLGWSGAQHWHSRSGMNQVCGTLLTYFAGFSGSGVSKSRVGALCFKRRDIFHNNYA